MSRDLELIEDFLHGRLSSEDEVTFEKKRSSDGDFSRLLEKEQKLMDTLSDVKSRNFVVNVKNIVEATTLQRNSRRGLRRWVGIASAASLLLVSGLLFFLPTQSQSPEALFQQYFASYPMLLAQRDVSAGTFQDFVSMYQNEDWDDVIRMSRDPGIQAAYPNLIDLYESIAHLQRGEGHEALQILQQERDLSPDLAIAYLWYQSMAFLQVSDPGQAKDILRQLVDLQPGGSWQRDAEQILKALE